MNEKKPDFLKNVVNLEEYRVANAAKKQRNEKQPDLKDIINLEEHREANGAKKQQNEKQPDLIKNLVKEYWATAAKKPRMVDNSQVPPNTAKTYRNFFIFLFLLLFLFSSLVFLNNPSPIDTSLCQSKVNEDGTKEVIFEKEPNSKHFTCRGYINGQEVKFIFDTGADYVTIPEKYQAFLGLRKRGTSSAETAGGRVLVYPTVIRNITIGHISIAYVPGFISTGMEIDAVLLGMSFLEKVEFHSGNNQVILRQ
jgi:clan AA aspartic protease (TIGR02281 family)